METPPRNLIPQNTFRGRVELFPLCIKADLTAWRGPAWY